MTALMPIPPSAEPAPSDAVRLARQLIRCRGMFSLVFVQWNHPGRENLVLDAIRDEDNHPRLQPVTVVSDNPSDLLPTLVAAQRKNPTADALCVFGLHRLFPDFLTAKPNARPPVLSIFNMQRELFRRELSCGIVLWLSDPALELVAKGAPDFWSWRSGLYHLDLPDEHRRDVFANYDWHDSGRRLDIPQADIPVHINGLLASWSDRNFDGEIAPREWESCVDIAERLIDLYSRYPDFSEVENWRSYAIDLRKKLRNQVDRSASKRANDAHAEGILWAERKGGSRSENLRQAIACCNAALMVHTRETYPQQWAATQSNLGSAYADLPDGDRGENLKSAIDCYNAALTVRTKEAFPQEWAMTQNNLGATYADRPYGDRGINLRLAIACYNATLTVRSKKVFPQEWAMTQNNLGNAYASLPDGDRRASLKSAIACYIAALSVFTKESFLESWAMTQNNLGNAYSERSEGDRGANLQMAIASYNAALTVTTKATFPQEWAVTQNNLGNAYSTLHYGDTVVNQRSAIACYVAALTVRTKEAFPQEWATTLNNLGNAYRNLPDGNEMANLQSAIACYNAALTVHTEAAFPEEWAAAHFNLGLLLEDFAEIEDPEVHLQQAETHLVNAELGFTTAGIAMSLPSVRDALSRVRAKLAEREPGGDSG